MPSIGIRRRTKSGRFSKRGKFVAYQGRLILYKTYSVVGPPAPTKRAPATAATAPATAEPRLQVPEPIRTAPESGRKGGRFTTWFRALGTMGTLQEMRGAESPDLLGEDLEEFGAPAAFYSNQGGLLGQVRFRGVIPLEVLIDRLNIKLQFVGEESGDFDFRTAYSKWEYRYQIVETLGPTDTVIEERTDMWPRRRRGG